MRCAICDNPNTTFRKGEYLCQSCISSIASCSYEMAMLNPKHGMEPSKEEGEVPTLIERNEDE